MLKSTYSHVFDRSLVKYSSQLYQGRRGACQHSSHWKHFLGHLKILPVTFINITSHPYHSTERQLNGVFIVFFQKEQLNSTLPLSRKLLPSSDEVDEKDKIALQLKEICGGNSDARSMSPCPSLELPITDQHEQRLNDLENKVAQLNSVLKENRQLKQEVSDLTNELHRVHSKVGCLEQTFQANLRAVHDEIVNVQVQMSAFMISPFPQEERARLMESIQGIQQRIGRLEQHMQSYGNMIGAMSTSLTRVANAVERDRMPAVDIRRL